jgi:hypothetical protein
MDSSGLSWVGAETGGGRNGGRIQLRVCHPAAICPAWRQGIPRAGASTGRGRLKVGGQDTERKQGVMECRIRDVPVYYEEVGAGRPVLLLNGRTGDHRYVAAHMEAVFAQRPGWRGLYPDLLGMGLMINGVAVHASPPP